MSKAAETASKLKKKKIDWNDYTLSQEAQPKGAPKGQTSLSPGSPDAQHASMPNASTSQAPGSPDGSNAQHASVPDGPSAQSANLSSNSNAQTAKRKKATIYFDEKAQHVLMQIYIKQLQAGQKAEKSEIVCKALMLLGEKEGVVK